MYNLFVTYAAGQWDKGACEYATDRVIRGYTDDALRDRFKELDEAAISELTSYPCLFVYEEGREDKAFLGWLKRIKPRSNAVRIEFEMEESLPPLSGEAIKKLSSELDIRGYELTNTHWAVKDIDLLPALIKGGLVSEDAVKGQAKDSRIIQFGFTKAVTQLQVRPSVFRVPAAKAEPDLVSVMMPLDMSFKAVYEALKAACGAVELRCQRADDIWDEAEVIQDIFSLIYRSRVVICDFSGRNPNVFYEAGIAHTLGKLVIPIVQNEGDIPFDLRHIRYIKYLDNNEGRELLTNDIAAKLRTIIGA